MDDRTDKIEKVLITGAVGSTGRYLTEYLRENRPNVEIYGIVRRKNSRQPLPGIVLYEGDLLDTASLIRIVRTTLPDVVFHFAANPDKGFEIPSAILQNNLIGTANLLEAVRAVHEAVVYRPIFINVSSSEVYGAVRPDEVPIKEDCPMRPQSPYGISKMAQDHLGQVYHKAYGMKIITTRAFTYINPLRLDLFTSAFARQIAYIEAGKQAVLKHGNLDSVRVVVDSKDIAEAYWLAATRCCFGEVYNIGGAKPISVGQVLDMLKILSPKTIPTEQDPSLMRLLDVTLQVPDCTKFIKETNWSPKRDLNSSLQTLLNYWRRKVQNDSM